MIRRLIGVLLMIIGLAALSTALTLALQFIEGTQVEVLTSTFTITIFNETSFGAPSNFFVKKGFFDSVGEVYVYMYSPYANYWNTFNLWMSLDNSSWTVVPFRESTTENTSQMADLGLISFSDPQLVIYQKSYVPSQTVHLPPNVTKEDASALTAYLSIKRRATPADTGTWIAVFFAAFGFIGAILAIYERRKDANSATQNAVKGRKKKSRTKVRKKS